MEPQERKKGKKKMQICKNTYAQTDTEQDSYSDRKRERSSKTHTHTHTHTYTVCVSLSLTRTPQITATETETETATHALTHTNTHTRTHTRCSDDIGSAGRHYRSSTAPNTSLFGFPRRIRALPQCRINFAFFHSVLRVESESDADEVRGFGDRGWARCFDLCGCVCVVLLLVA